MQVVKAELVRRSKYGSLIFDHLNCSKAIVEEKLTNFDIAIWPCGIESIKDSVNERFRLLGQI